jgi:hypothetical protein
MAKKDDRKKELEAQAKAAGASVKQDGKAFVLTLPGERNSLRVTEDTDQHAIDRYLRGVNV